MQFSSYLALSTQLLNQYKGEVPFAAWLKNHFRQHKKFGSRDRKLIAQFCFAFFRLGNAFSHLSVEEKIVTAVFLTANESQPLLYEVQPEWNKHIHLTVQEKLEWLNAGEEVNQIFPFPDEVSAELDKPSFFIAHLTQPFLFLRLRPGKEAVVRQKIARAGLVFIEEKANCISLPNSTKATDVIETDKEAVVQDYSSQQVLNLLPEELFQQPLTVWDCCAASGGKSLLLFDKNPKVKLTVSDVRESILVNLRKRFAAAGIIRYQSFIADLSAINYKPPTTNYKLIICDAPCSGSGTWGRTPEQLSFFTKEKLRHYSTLQKKISVNAAKALAPGGYFLYITCSVYKEENEGAVSHLQNHTGLQLVKKQYFKGYDKQADTLFAALFQL
jgi:16S rRNA (cytosine967-C5)-methyltransferase